MTRLSAAAAILIMAGIGAAVGGSGTQPPPKQNASAGFDPCTLMTKEEAAAAIGEAVGEPKPLVGRSAGPGTTVAHCEYESRARNSVQVTVWRFSGDSA